MAYSGATNVSGGTLQIGNGDSATFASPSVNLSNSGALAFNHSTIVNYSGAITGVGSVSKAGPGTLTLSGAITTRTAPPSMRARSYSAATVHTAGARLSTAASCTPLARSPGPRLSMPAIYTPTAR